MSSFEIVTFPVVVADSRHRLTSVKKQSRIGEFSRRSKTEQAKSQVDNKSPPAQIHQYFKVTKLQKLKLPKIVEQDSTEKPNVPVKLDNEAQKKIWLIERENKGLSTRLANIYRGSGMVDCWNEYQKKSSFRQKQNIELVRITLENQGILKRIKERKPNYDRKQSELEWQNSRKYLRKSTCFLIANRDGRLQSIVGKMGMASLLCGIKRKLGCARNSKSLGAARNITVS